MSDREDQASSETPSLECKPCSHVFKEEYSLTRHIKIDMSETASFTRHDNFFKHKKRVHSVMNQKVKLIGKHRKKFLYELS